jgi:hypothetical protein
MREALDRSPIGETEKPRPAMPLEAHWCAMFVRTRARALMDLDEMAEPWFPVLVEWE